MGLSESIVAAIIGATATVITAVIQLFKNRPPTDSRPKKNRLRSVTATVALAVACVVGGYAWSSLRAVNAKEELRATMKAEFAEQFAALAARKEQSDAEQAALRTGFRDRGSAESLVHLPPCRLQTDPDEVGPVTCTVRDAEKLALCAKVPAGTTVVAVRVFARAPTGDEPWEERDSDAPTLGSLHFGAAPEEFPVDADSRSVCLDVANRSVEEKVAVRLLVEYATPPPSAPELTAATPTVATAH